MPTLPSSNADTETAKALPLIYVVDDEPLVGEVVETVLNLEGYPTRLFQDPQLALQALATQPPALLLTDFLMPGMNGMELIHAGRTSHPQMKTILFSGNVQEDILDQFPVKPDHFIRKPFYPQTLLDLVQNILSK